MINRDNYHDVNKYRNYLREVKANSESTLNRRRSQLRHLLEWADAIPLSQAHKIRPRFPTYLEDARNDGRDKPLASSSQRANCGVARRFFHWAKRKFPRRYKDITPLWIDSLQGPRKVSNATDRDPFTIADLHAILDVSPKKLIERRDRAAIAFLFLSGARDGAFVSLPIHAIDLDVLKVQQMPCLGVNTKYEKSATTYLLNIPNLLGVVRDWDQLVRDDLPPNALWYATLTRDGTGFTGKTQPGSSRAAAVREGLQTLCQRANIPYRCPHNLRHGHAVYAIQRCKTMADLKAVSQNLMHESVVTTEKIYGGLPNDTVKNRIDALTNKQRSTIESDAHLLQILLEKIEAIDSSLEPIQKLNELIDLGVDPADLGKRTKGTS